MVLSNFFSLKPFPKSICNFIGSKGFLHIDIFVNMLRKRCGSLLCQWRSPNNTNMLIIPLKSLMADLLLEPTWFLGVHPLHLIKSPLCANFPRPV